MLSLSRMEIPCSGPRGPRLLRSVSSRSAMASASGLISITLWSAGPLRSIASIRARYFSTTDRDVSVPVCMRCCRSAIVASSRSNAGREGDCAPAVANRTPSRPLKNALDFLILNGCCRLFDEPFNLRSGSGAGHSCELSPSREHRKRRNRPDGISLAELLQVVGVDFYDQDPPGLVRRHLFELRPDHAAWPAPRRPVIDDYRKSRARDEAIEVCRLIDFDRFARQKHRLLALPASHFAVKALVWQPVFLAAPGALHDHAAVVEIDR